MSGYLQIDKIIMPRDCLVIAYDHMRKAGQERLEAVALFAGKEAGAVFTIEKTILPRQRAVSLEDGLLYAVDGDELHRMNVWLYENNMSLIAQIHSHPTKAFHSATDDKFPIVATVGGISIVAPDFATGPVDLESCAIYRLIPDKGWVKMEIAKVRQFIQLIS
jgi:hypothetical protein